MKAAFTLLYNGANITSDISEHLLDINYTDNVTGVSDELEIKLEDKDAKWQNEWYPDKGAILTLTIGYEDGSAVKPNPFELDTIKLSGSKSSGDVVTIKGIGAGVTKQLHTKHSHAHENKTLSEIVHTIAAKYGYTVVGNIASISIGRVSQHREKDITFLNRLADEYGYAFTIKANKLIFHSLQELEAAAHVTTIDKTDCIDWDIDDKGIAIYSHAQVTSHNPNKNKVITGSSSVYTKTNNDGVQFSYLKEADNSLQVHTKTESEQQANVKADAVLHKHNSLQQTGNITIPGNVLLLAGVNFQFTGIGKNSGIWHVLKSQHKLNKSEGYITVAEIKRIIPATLSNSNTVAKKIKAKNNSYAVVAVKNKDGITFNTLQTK